MDDALPVHVREMLTYHRPKAIRTAGLALLEQICWSATTTEPVHANDVAHLRPDQPAIVPFVFVSGTDVIVNAAWLKPGETLTHCSAEIRTVQSYDLKFAQVQRFDVSTVSDALAANKVRPFTDVLWANCCLRALFRLCVRSCRTV